MVVIIQDLEVVTKSTFLATLFTVIIMVAEVVVEIEIAPMPGGEMSDLYCNVELKKINTASRDCITNYTMPLLLTIK